MSENLLAICTFNRKNDLEVLFKSLLKIDLRATSILLVDATSSDNDIYWDWVNSAQKELRQVLTAAKIVWIPHKKGLTFQRNSALKFAETNGFDFIHFIDDDVELHHDYLRTISEYFRLNDKCVGITGQRIDEYPNISLIDGKSPHKLYSILQKKINGESSYGSVSISGLNNMSYGESTLEVNWLSGCSMSYRLEGIKGKFFSEEFSDYSLMEDLDFSFSLNEFGQLIYLPSAKLKHNISQANRWNYLKGLRIEAHNRTAFVYKYRDKLSLTRHLASYTLTIFRLLLQSLQKRNRLSEALAILRGLSTGLHRRTYL
jgi:GT2 family glycosyltransferase